jgi:hypothetical protein
MVEFPHRSAGGMLQNRSIFFAAGSYGVERPACALLGGIKLGYLIKSPCAIHILLQLIGWESEEHPAFRISR